MAKTMTAQVRKRDAEATRARILKAALAEFPKRGIRETRIDDIAKRSNINRRMIYYYFGSKQGLYLAALEQVYADLVDMERKIDVEGLDPVAAMEKLVNLKVDHYTRFPGFVAFLNMENMNRARSLSRSKRLDEFKTPLTTIISRVLERGQSIGLFRRDVDPVDLYISICALGFFYFSNRHTLGVIFGQELDSPPALERRKGTIVDLITSYLQRASDRLDLPAPPHLEQAAAPAQARPAPARAAGTKRQAGRRSA